MNISGYKKSINESAFTLAQAAIVWDFYVTKSVADSAAQKRNIKKDYDIPKLPFEEMLSIAGITEDNCCSLLADKMPKTLEKLKLDISKEEDFTDIDTLRMAYLIPYQISDDEKPKEKQGSSKAVALFTHIRNAFAHGNTYYFDNGNVLLVDKKGATITAMILIHQKTLLDWIALIDKNQKFYVLHDVCKSCHYNDIK